MNNTTMHTVNMKPAVIPIAQPEEGPAFLELRRKIRQAELLNAATEKLLFGLRFTGKLSVIIQNGRILKSGYEEGYFRQNQ